VDDGIERTGVDAACGSQPVGEGLFCGLASSHRWFLEMSHMVAQDGVCSMSQGRGSR